MNALFLFVWCLVGFDPPQESVAIVDLRECLRHVPESRSDRNEIARLITLADAEAKSRHEVLTKAEARSRLEGATARDVAKARILKLEFEEFRCREQIRIRDAEQGMLLDWHKQIDTAVKTVARRDGFTIVLYVGQERDDAELAMPEAKQMLSKTHAAYVVPQQRIDITNKVVAELSTDESREAVKVRTMSEQ